MSTLLPIILFSKNPEAYNECMTHGLASISDTDCSVLLTDRNARILFANNAIEYRNGFSPSEAFERSPQDLWGHQMNNAYYAELWKSLHRQHFTTTTVTNRHSDGTLFNETLHIFKFSSRAQIHFLEVQPHKNTCNHFLHFAEQFNGSFGSFKKLFTDYIAKLENIHSFEQLTDALTGSTHEKHKDRLQDRKTFQSLETDQAFSKLYEKYFTAILQYFRGKVSSDIAHEMTQEVFLRAWNAFEAFTPRASYKTYLLRLSHRLFIDYLRRHSPNGQLFFEPHDRSHTESSIDCSLLLHRLSTQERELIELFYLEGYKAREIARKWNTTENAIKLRLSRLRKRLRNTA